MPDMLLIIITLASLMLCVISDDFCIKWCFGLLFILSAVWLGVWVVSDSEVIETEHLKIVEVKTPLGSTKQYAYYNSDTRCLDVVAHFGSLIDTEEQFIYRKIYNKWKCGIYATHFGDIQEFKLGHTTHTTIRFDKMPK